MKRFWIALLGLSILLSGCSESMDVLSDAPDPVEVSPTVDPTQSTEAVTATIPQDLELFTDRDSRTEYEDQVATLVFDGNTLSGDVDAVVTSGSTVTLSDPGTFVLQGNFTGTILVDAPKDEKLQIVLDNIQIQGKETAPLYIRQADKVFITLKDGTNNTLIAPESFAAIDENNVDGAIFSKADLTFNGSGSLILECTTGHGIVAKDDLAVCGGNYTVSCAGHGVQANDSIRIRQAQWQITAGKDGFHAENEEDSQLGFVYVESGNYTIDAQGDGISAGAWMQILDGSFAIVTGGGSVNGDKASSSGYGGFMGDFGGRPGGFGQMEAAADTDSTSLKGMKATGALEIQNGSFTLDCADDAIHSNASVTVLSGDYTITTGDDGIHGDETLIIKGGNITVNESYEGLEALDIQIMDGNIRLVCSDDGINAAGGNDASGFGGGRGDMFGGRGGGGRGGNPGGFGGMGGGGNGSITISGGTVYMNASGDGIDANGSLTITGGHVTVCGPTKGDTAVLDYDNSATITGGTFIGTGSSMMAQSFSQSSQGVLALSMGGNLTAGTPIQITDSNGTVIMEYTPALDYAILIFSTPELIKGESYTVTIGDQSGTFAAG